MTVAVIFASLSGPQENQRFQPTLDPNHRFGVICGLELERQPNVLRKGDLAQLCIAEMCIAKMYTARRRTCAAFLGVSAGVALAWLPVGAGVQAQTLADALAAAYLNNPTLLAARAGLRATDEGVPQAISNWRPDVSVTADLGVSQIDNTRNAGSDVNQTRHPKGFGIKVTQPLFRGGRTSAAMSRAENSVRAERARLMSVEQTVLSDAVSTYMNVFRDQAVLKLNINNEQVLKRQLEATRDRFEVGEITRTDVHQAEARLARAVADRIQSEGDLEASRAAFENVVGEAAPADLQLPSLPSNLPDEKADALKIAATKNPNVIGAEFDRRAALDNTDGVSGELQPELKLVGSWARDYQRTAECCQSTTRSLTLNLTIPIYQQGSVYSRLREARQDAAESALLIDQQRRDAIEAAAAAWESLITARARVKAFNAQIDANVVALEGVEREAAVGSRTVLDVLDAEQELLDSRVAHVRVQRDEVVATYQLLSSVGRMTARDLELPVTLYDSREHYKEVRDKWAGGKSQGGVK